MLPVQYNGLDEMIVIKKYNNLKHELRMLIRKRAKTLLIERKKMHIKNFYEANKNILED